MRSKVRRAGPKPAVAFVNQATALENIRLKRSVISLIARGASGQGPTSVQGQHSLDALIASLPSTRRQFNAWTSQALPPIWADKYGIFGTNADVTLKKSSELRLVEDALDSVRLLKGRPKPEEQRAATKARLQGLVNLANRLRIIAEREVVRLIREVGRQADEITTLNRQIKAAEAEGQRAANDAALTIKVLEARLQSGRSNVVPLSSERGGKGRKR